MNRSSFVVAAAVAAALVVPVAASAAWQPTGSASGSATLSSIGTGSQPTVNVSGTTATVSWAASTVASGVNATSYTVAYYAAAADGTAEGSQSCATTSCSFNNVTAGDHYWGVTPVYRNWVGTEGTRSKATVASAATFHVGGLESSNKHSVNPQKWMTAVTITVVDQTGTPVAGVTGIAGTLVDANNTAVGTTLTCALATDAAGKCTTSDSGNIDKSTQATVTFTPSGSPIKTNYTYDASANSPSSLAISFP